MFGSPIDAFGIFEGFLWAPVNTDRQRLAPRYEYIHPTGPQDEGNVYPETKIVVRDRTPPGAYMSSNYPGEWISPVSLMELVVGSDRLGAADLFVGKDRADSAKEIKYVSQSLRR